MSKDGHVREASSRAIMPVVSRSLDTAQNETPQMKALYKKISDNIRLKDWESLESAREYAEKALPGLHESSRWRVYVEVRRFIPSKFPIFFSMRPKKLLLSAGGDGKAQ
jgi:hypothetical protein